jgi:hypothetical protein
MLPSHFSVIQVAISQENTPTRFINITIITNFFIC